MQFIRTTQSKLSNPLNPKSSRRYGIFLCPSCNKEVEKDLSHGRRNKTCGDRTCRKAAFVKNPNQVQNGGRVEFATEDENKVALTSLEFYNATKSVYDRAKRDSNLEIAFPTTLSFFNEFYSEVASLKAMHPSKQISCVKSNGKYEIIYLLYAKYKYAEYIGEFEFCSHRLAKETDTEHSTVREKIKKMKIDVPYEKFRITTNSFTNVYNLTQEKYEEMKTVIMHGKQKNKSSFLYMIISGKFVKIGITHNISKRFFSLQGSSPTPITLYHSVYLGVSARNVEKYLHKEYAAFNQNREWFRLSKTQMEMLKNDLDEEFGNRLAKKISYENEQKINLEKIDQKNRFKVNKAKHQAYLVALRQKNIKPVIETITNQDLTPVVPRQSQKHLDSITKHGKSGTPFYSSWRSMKERCKNTNRIMCNRWESFENYSMDMIDEYIEKAALWEPLGDSPAMVLKKVENVYNKNNIDIVKRSETGGLSRARKVNQISLDGALLNSFDNAVVASKETGADKSKINAVCNGKRKTSGGFKWEFAS